MHQFIDRRFKFFEIGKYYLNKKKSISSAEQALSQKLHTQDQKKHITVK